MSKNSRYIKAPGRGRQVSSYHTLWFGEHELLQVDHKNTRENYEHLFYRDICAIYIRRNRKRAVRLSLYSVFLLLALFFFFIGPPLSIVGYLIGSISLFAIIRDLRAGPGCDCYAITAVKRYQIHPWNGLRIAQKGAAILRERVINASEKSGSPS